MDNMQTDILMPTASGFSGTGEVAQRLLSENFNVNALRTNTILQKEEWQHFDSVVVDIARHRLNGVNRMMGSGLSFNLPNALGSTVIQWERMGDMSAAEVDMSGVTEGQRDRVTFDLASMPVPIFHKGFELNIRHLSASRRMGQPLDTTQAQIASRKVSEAIEAALFGGIAITVLGNTVPGLRTQTNRLTDSQTANWNVATGAQILDDILDAITSLQASANAMYGPYGIFVPYDAYNHMSDDFKAESDRTILERVLAIPGISWVQPVVDIPTGQSIIFQLTSDVAEIIDGIQPSLVQWESMGGMKFHFKVIAIMLPRIRATKTNQSGIMHLTA